MLYYNSQKSVTKNLKGGQEKKNGNLPVGGKEKLHQAIRRFLSRNSEKQDKREWNDILKRLKDKNCHPRRLPPAKLSFIQEGKIVFPRQIKAEGVQQHQTCLIRNDERSSYTKNKKEKVNKTLINKMKIPASALPPVEYSQEARFEIIFLFSTDFGLSFL